MRESLYTGVIMWVNTILNHIDTRPIFPRYESSCIVYRPEWYLKMWSPHYRYLNDVKKEEETSPVQHWLWPRVDLRFKVQLLLLGQQDLTVGGKDLSEPCSPCSYHLLFYIWMSYVERDKKSYFTGLWWQKVFEFVWCSSSMALT